MFSVYYICTRCGITRGMYIYVHTGYIIMHIKRLFHANIIALSYLVNHSSQQSKTATTTRIDTVMSEAAG